MPKYMILTANEKSATSDYLVQLVLLVLLLVAFYMVSCDYAYAQATWQVKNPINIKTADLTSPMGNVTCNILLFLLGNLGRAIAVLAIIVLGIGASLGKVSWGLAI